MGKCHLTPDRRVQRGSSLRGEALEGWEKPRWKFSMEIQTRDLANLLNCCWQVLSVEPIRIAGRLPGNLPSPLFGSVLEFHRTGFDSVVC